MDSINQRPTEGRLIGNKHTKEIHNLEKENTKGNGCQIDKFIKSGHGTTVTNAEPLLKKDWSLCAKCFNRDMSSS